MNPGTGTICGEYTTGNLVFLIGLIFVTTLGLVTKVLSKSERCALWLPVLRIAWPRFVQSFNIIVSNFQVGFHQHF